MGPLVSEVVRVVTTRGRALSHPARRTRAAHPGTQFFSSRLPNASSNAVTTVCRSYGLSSMRIALVRGTASEKPVAKHHRNTRMPVLDVAREIHAAHAARHDDVGQHDIHRPRLEDLTRRKRVGSDEDVEAGRAQRGSHHFGDERVVLDEQDRRRRRHARQGAQRVFGLLSHCTSRSRNDEIDARAAPALAFYFRRASRLRHEAVDLREPQPRSLTDFLRGEERLEHA